MNFKKLIAGAMAVLMLAGCGSTAAAAVQETPAAASTQAAVKSDDQVITDYQGAEASALNYSFKQADGKMSPWMPMSDSEEVTRLNQQIAEVLSSKLTAAEEDELSEDNLLFEIQPKTGEIIYFYSDAYVKTVGIGSRNFYKLDASDVVDAVSAAVTALSDAASAE